MYKEFSAEYTCKRIITGNYALRRKGARHCRPLCKKEGNKMAKVDIFSGFLGAGKTTLIKKLISEGYDTKNIVLIENEFGEIGVDTGFLRESGIQINEMVAGCICCTLVGDFGKALNTIILS